MPPTDATRPVARALLSVSDKTGLVELGQGLAARGVDRQNLHAVDLAGEAAPDELLDLQADGRPDRGRDARHVEREFLPGLVPGDLGRAANPLLFEGRDEMWNGLIRHSGPSGDERSRRSRHRASGDHITSIPDGQVARHLTNPSVLRI